MPILQYRCRGCAAVFEYLSALPTEVNVDCVSCGGSDISRMDGTFFYPNKTFCPHDKELDSEVLRGELSGVMSNTTQKCGGCGTDGSPGKCKSGEGSGCGSGGGCGGGCSCKK